MLVLQHQFKYIFYSIIFKRLAVLCLQEIAKKFRKFVKVSFFGGGLGDTSFHSPLKYLKEYLLITH